MLLIFGVPNEHRAVLVACSGSWAVGHHGYTFSYRTYVLPTSIILNISSHRHWRIQRVNRYWGLTFCIPIRSRSSWVQSIRPRGFLLFGFANWLLKEVPVKTYFACDFAFGFNAFIARLHFVRYYCFLHMSYVSFSHPVSMIYGKQIGRWTFRKRNSDLLLFIKSVVIVIFLLMPCKWW